MIKFFSQRGRGTLAVLLAGNCLFILIGLICLLLQSGMPSGVAVTIGSICLGIAIVTLLGLSMYLSTREIRSVDILKLVLQHQEMVLRIQADVGALHISTVKFREMSGWDKAKFLAVLIVAITFITMGLLDMMGIWPSHVLELRNTRGEMVKIDRVTSSLVGLTSGAMCIIVLISLRMRFVDDWNESLKKLFDEFGIK
mgnify:CR=1 FL=1